MGQIKTYLRTGDFLRNELIFNMHQLDNIIIDLTPSVKKWEKKYDEIYS